MRLRPLLKRCMLVYSFVLAVCTIIVADVISAETVLSPVHTVDYSRRIRRQSPNLLPCISDSEYLG